MTCHVSPVVLSIRGHSISWQLRINLCTQRATSRKTDLEANSSLAEHRVISPPSRTDRMEIGGYLSVSSEYESKSRDAGSKTCFLFCGPQGESRQGQTGRSHKHIWFGSKASKERNKLLVWPQKNKFKHSWHATNDNFHYPVFFMNLLIIYCSVIFYFS